jgi:hypothetical protein
MLKEPMKSSVHQTLTHTLGLRRAWGKMSI